MICDSLRSKSKYPNYWQILCLRALGAESISCLLKDEGLTSLIIFNGRTASLSTIVSTAYSEGISIYYYEMSLISRSFSFYPHAPHALNKLSHDVVYDYLYQGRLLNICNLFPPLAPSSSCFSSLTTDSSDQLYETVVLLGSDFEYTNPMEEIVGITFHGNQKLIMFAHDVLKNISDFYPVVVRAHPNIRNDPSCTILDHNYKPLCGEFGFEYIPCTSSVDTYELIRLSNAASACLHCLVIIRAGDFGLKARPRTTIALDGSIGCSATESHSVPAHTIPSSTTQPRFSIGLLYPLRVGDWLPV